MGITGLLLYVKPLAQFFKFETLNLFQLSISVSIGFISVIWYELVKWRTRKKETGISL
jgi:P-type Ca2+ transporter type 2C